MIWNLIIKIFTKKKSIYTRLVKVGNKIFIIRIEEYKPVTEELKEWESALGKAMHKAPGAQC